MEIIIISLSYLAAAAIGAISKKRSVVEYTAIAASGISLVASASIVYKTVTLGGYTYSSLFFVNPLSALILLSTAFIGLMTAIYSKGYFQEETTREIIGFTRVKQYFVLSSLFIMSMMLAVSANNPILMWILIEATTLSTAFLISFYSQQSSMEAAWKYLIINSIGLLLGFLGTLIYFTATKSTNTEELLTWDILLNSAKNLDPALAKIAFTFVLIGYGTKVGLFPMHTWKPDAYSKAPTPTAALFSSALLNVAFLAILKFKIITDAAVGALYTQKLLIIFGALSIAIAAMMMLIQKNYKRLLAYSSIEHAGIIALGFGFGGIGIFASILHMIYHSLIKPILFFTTGNIFLKYNSTKISNIKGAFVSLPLTSKLFMVGLLAVTGTPPFGIFFTKLQILSAGMKDYPIIITLSLVFLVIIFISFLKHATDMLFDKKPEDVAVGEANLWTTLPIVCMAAVLVYLTFFMPPFINSLLNAAALQ